MTQLNVIGKENKCNACTECEIPSGYPQKEPLKTKLDYELPKKKKKKAMIERESFIKKSIEKYSELDKNALLNRLAQFEWLMMGVSKALDLLRPFTSLLLGQSKLSQAFNLLSEAVEDWKERKERTRVQMW